jgi:hypothetical protein
VFFIMLAQLAHHVDVKLAHTIELADRTIAETGEAMTNVRDASRAWNKNSAAQAQAILATERKAQRSMGDLDDFIEHADRQFNGMVLPQLSNLVAHQDASLDDMEKQVSIATSKFSRDSSAMLEQTTTLISKLSQDAADPAIQASLKNIEITTANTAATTKNLQDTTVVLENYAKRLTKPASMLKQVALGALQVGFQLRGLLGL